MVYVDAGPFLMGSDDADAEPDVRPRRTVQLGAFYIDRTEVTNADYKKLVPGHTFAPGGETFPVTHVTRDEAAAYLRLLGKRLPTSAEWEKAARGTDGRRYPWGDEPPSARVLHAERLSIKTVRRPAHSCAPQRTEAVGQYLAGASPYGCLDMAANAWEWVSDDYPSTPPRQIIRGGAYGYQEKSLRTYAFGIEDPGVT